MLAEVTRQVVRDLEDVLIERVGVAEPLCAEPNRGTAAERVVFVVHNNRGILVLRRGGAAIADELDVRQDLVGPAVTDLAEELRYRRVGLVSDVVGGRLRLEEVRIDAP